MPLFKENKQEKKKFVICSQDFCGLGFAKMTKDAGYEVILAYKMKEPEKPEDEVSGVSGDGIVEKEELDTLWKKRGSMKDWYWIFDQNYLWEYSEKLRKEGFKVFGAMEITHNMEHDRKFGTDIIKQYNIPTPETHEFNSIEDGLGFLKENEDRAFVFKPDESSESFTTYVPESEKDKHANAELQTYMRSLDDDGTTYILQERKKGVEINLEVWFYEGEPFFAFATLESKRKLGRDAGEMTGCAQDMLFTVGLDTRIVAETVGKMYPFYKKLKYTGFADFNGIIADRDVYFLEFCNRFGYNSHPNLFMTLAKEPFPVLMADIMDGNIKDFRKRFKYGFGSSIILYIDHPRAGFPIYVKEDVEDKFYHFDAYKDEEGYKMSGDSTEIGIITGHGYTVKESAEDVLKNSGKVIFPMKAMRYDINDNDYPSAPQGRVDALEHMDWLEKNENTN